jgi:hypothetical protein
MTVAAALTVGFVSGAATVTALVLWFLNSASDAFNRHRGGRRG